MVGFSEDSSIYGSGIAAILSRGLNCDEVGISHASATIGNCYQISYLENLLGLISIKSIFAIFCKYRFEGLGTTSK